LAGEVDGKALDDRSDHAARAAPGGPEVDQDRERALLDNGGEVTARHVSEPGQRSSARGAVRHPSSRHSNAALLPATGARDHLRVIHRSPTLYPPPAVPESAHRREMMTRMMMTPAMQRSIFTTSPVVPNPTAH